MRTTFWRPRLLAYAIVVAAAVTGLSLLLARRAPVEFELIRVTGAPFYVQSDGKVCNRFRVRLTNRTASAQQVRVTLLHPEPGELITGEQPMALGPLQVRSVEGVIRVPPGALPTGRAAGTIEVETADGQQGRRQLVLLGPSGGG